MFKGSRYLIALLFSPVALASPPSISISWSPSTVNLGGTSTLSWSVSGATSCVDQNNNAAGMSLSWTSSPRTVPGVQTKTLICTGPGGTSSASASLTILAPPPPPPPPAPSVSVSWSPSTIYVGETSTLSWSSSGADYCTDQNGSSVATSLTWTSSPRTSVGSQTKTINCTNRGGTSSSSATLNVIPRPPKPSVSMSFSPSTVELGQSTTLSWSSSSASSCTIDGSSVSTTGSTNYTPTSALTKSLVCHNAQGSSSTSASVSVVAPPSPSISVTWTPDSVQMGETSLLKWDISNATHCTDTGSGSAMAPKNGTWPSSPRTGNSTKSIQCYNQSPQYSASATSTLTVTAPKAPVNFQASRSGQDIALSWGAPSHKNASQLTFKVEESINNGSWTQVSSGSAKSVTLENKPFNSNISYRISSCYSSSCGAVASATVSGLSAPTINIYWDRNPVEKGDKPTLSWRVTNATHCKDQVTGETAALSFDGISTPRTFNTTKTLECYNQIPANSTVKSATLVVGPLKAPANFTATRQSDGSIQLSWDAKANYLGTLSTVLTESVNNGAPTPLALTPKITSLKRPNSASDNSYSYAIKYCSGSDCSPVAQAQQAAIPKPEITIKWSPSTVQAGEKPSLTWGMRNATKCYDTDSKAKVNVVSSVTVEVSARTLNTVKKITCENTSPSVSDKASKLLTVTDPNAVTNLELAKQSNNTATLTWQASHSNPSVLVYKINGVNHQGQTQALSQQTGSTSYPVSAANLSAYKTFTVTACYATRCSPAVQTAAPDAANIQLTLPSSASPFETALLSWKITNASGCKLMFNNDSASVKNISHTGSQLSPVFSTPGTIPVNISCSDGVSKSKNLVISGGNNIYLDISNITTGSNINAAIRAKFDLAANHGKNLILTGKATLSDNWTISKEVLKNVGIFDAKATEVTLTNSTIELSNISGKTLYTPTVFVLSDKPGVRFTNISGNQIHLSLIRGTGKPSGTGLEFNNNGGSISANVFHLSKIFNFETNVSMACSTAGYTINTNQFIAGQVARGIASSDYIQGSVLWTMSAHNNTCISNNTWFSTSMEGTRDGTYKRLAIHGSNNHFINNRWEGVHLCKNGTCAAAPKKDAQITVKGNNNTILSGYEEDEFILSLKGRKDDGKTICAYQGSVGNIVKGWIRDKKVDPNNKDQKLTYWPWHQPQIALLCK